MKESLLQIEGHRKCELIIIIWLEAAFLHWEWLDLRVKLAPRLLHHQHKNSHLYHHLLKMCKTSPKFCLLQLYMSGLRYRLSCEAISGKHSFHCKHSCYLTVTRTKAIPVNCHIWPWWWRWWCCLFMFVWRSSPLESLSMIMSGIKWLSQGSHRG